MNAFLFPGQGSQEIGMAADLFKSDAFFRGLIQHASHYVGADLERICLRGPARELTRTKFLQPLLVCVSLGYHHQLLHRGVQPQIVLGHSLGEITALAAAGVVSAESAVDMAAKRGELMDIAAAQVAGGMVAVITDPRVTDARQKVLAWLAQSMPAERLVLANDNAPNQIVLSGQLDALDEAAQFIAHEKLGACRKLAVSGPWHSPLMLDAQREFAAWLQPVVFQAPAVPLLFNVSATSENDPEKIRQLAIQNLAHPILWRLCLDQLKSRSVRALFEVGPGRVLSGLARANGFDDAIRVVNVNNLRGVELAAAAAG